jgi:hypothetical protein
MPGVKGVHGGKKPGAGRPRKFNYTVHYTRENVQTVEHFTSYAAAVSRLNTLVARGQCTEICIVSRAIVNGSGAEM